MTEQVEMFDYFSKTCEDNFGEMCTFVLLAREDTLVTGDGKNNNNTNNNNVSLLNNNYNQNSKIEDYLLNESVKSLPQPTPTYKDNLTIKAKRGRPCAKPPTKDILGRRRKVFLFFILIFILTFLPNMLGCK